MLNETRVKYNQFLTHQASLNQVSDATHQYTVAPTAEQKLFEKVQESHVFLKSINSAMVANQIGEKSALA